MSRFITGGQVDGVEWVLERATFDLAPALRAVSDVAANLSPALRAVLERAMMETAYSPRRRIEVLTAMVSTLRRHSMQAAGAQLTAQRCDIALAMLDDVCRVADRDRLYLVLASGRRLVGLVQHSHCDGGCWYGHMAGDLGGTTLGPHEQDDGPVLLERMLRVGRGLPDTWRPPPLDDAAEMRRAVGG